MGTGQETVIIIDDDDTSSPPPSWDGFSSPTSHRTEVITIPEDGPPSAEEEERRRKAKEEALKKWEIFKIPKNGTERLFYDPPNPHVGGRRDTSTPSNFVPDYERANARKAQTAQRNAEKKRLAAEAKARVKAESEAAKQAEEEAAAVRKEEEKKEKARVKEEQKQADRKRKAEERLEKESKKHQEHLEWALECPEGFDAWVKTDEGNEAGKKGALMGYVMTGRTNPAYSALQPKFIDDFLGRSEDKDMPD